MSAKSVLHRKAATGNLNRVLLSVCPIVIGNPLVNPLQIFPHSKPCMRAFPSHGFPSFTNSHSNQQQDFFSFSAQARLLRFQQVFSNYSTSLVLPVLTVLSAKLQKWCLFAWREPAYGHFCEELSDLRIRHHRSATWAFCGDSGFLPRTKFAFTSCKTVRIQPVKYCLHIIVFVIPQLLAFEQFSFSCQSRLSPFLVLLEPLINCFLESYFVNDWRLFLHSLLSLLHWSCRRSQPDKDYLFHLLIFRSHRFIVCRHSASWPFLVPIFLSVHIPLGLPYKPVRWGAPVTLQGFS